MSYFIIIRGPLGVGKTTIANKLVQSLSAKYISVDTILDENRLTKDKEDGYISQKSFIEANSIAIAEAMPYLVKDKPIIFDGNFYWRSQVDDLLNRLSFSHYVFTLKAPLSVCIERDSKRTEPYGKDAAEVVYAKTSEFDYGVIIDATQDLEIVVSQIVSHLAAV